MGLSIKRTPNCWFQFWIFLKAVKKTLDLWNIFERKSFEESRDLINYPPDWERANQGMAVKIH